MNFLSKLKSVCTKEVLENQPLKDYTTICVGGNAKYMVFPQTKNEVLSIMNLVRVYNVKKFFLGCGSNVLVSDKGFDGVVINTSFLNGIEEKDDCISVYCGTKISELIAFMKERELTGLEFLSGIPATVGGAVCMNAGAFCKEIKENLINVEVLVNNHFVKVNSSACGFSYRNSLIKKHNIFIISANFKKVKGKSLKAEYALNFRRENQPKGKSFGSVFKNHEKYSAGYLIDRLNLKGFKVGDAEISNKHANFIINNGKAKASDVKEIIDYIKTKVYAVFGIKLLEEVVYLGEFN